MRFLGVPFTKRATQFVPPQLQARTPGALLRSGLWQVDPTAGLPVVHACLHTLTQRLASMPLRVFDDQRRPVPLPLWLHQPSPGFTGDDLICQIAVSLVQRGNAYLLPLRGDDGQVVELWCASPDQVTIYADTAGQVEYQVAGAPFDGELLHVRFIAIPGWVHGLSAWVAAREALEIGVAAQDYVRRHFSQSAHLQMAVVAKGTLTDEQQRSLRAQIRAAHMGDPGKAWSPLILDGDADVKPMSMTAQQAQFLELTTLTDAQIAAQIFRVPPALVGVQQAGTSLTYTNRQDLESQLYADATRPLALRIEHALSSLLPFGQTLDLDARDVLAGSPRDRVQNVATMKSTGAFTVNELREAMGYPAIDGVEGETLAAGGASAIIVGNDFPQLPATQPAE